jgi:hypothetical protein
MTTLNRFLVMGALCLGIGGATSDLASASPAHDHIPPPPRSAPQHHSELAILERRL